MATHKATFTLDRATVNYLEQCTARLRRSKSQIVREAIREYAARADRLSEAERLEMLAVLDRSGEVESKRSAEEVDAELEALRYSRQRGGRGTPSS